MNAMLSQRYAVAIARLQQGRAEAEAKVLKALESFHSKTTAVVETKTPEESTETKIISAASDGHQVVAQQGSRPNSS